MDFCFFGRHQKSLSWVAVLGLSIHKGSLSKKRYSYEKDFVILYYQIQSIHFISIILMTMTPSATSVGYIPDISFDEQAGLLRIEGESYPEYAIEYFQPICDKLRNYTAQHPKEAITAIFKMSYFNTSTSRRFFEIFSILNNHHKQGGKVSVKWYYKEDDIDVHDSGVDFSAQVSFDFQCISL